MTRRKILTINFDTKNIKAESSRRKMDGFIVEEELREETETLAEEALVPAVDFVDGEVALRIDLDSWRMRSFTFVLELIR